MNMSKPSKPPKPAVRCTGVVGDERKLRTKSGAGGGAEREKLCSENCCSTFCIREAKYILDVMLGKDNWWHFKCADTKNEASRWKRWRSKDGAKVRIRAGGGRVRRRRPHEGSSPTEKAEPQAGLGGLS